MVRWLRLPVLTGLLVLTLTGCALISPSAAQGNAQISQASAVQTNPCSLLTSVQLHQLGVETKLVDLGTHEMQGQTLQLPPAIIGRLGSDPAKKTVLVYGHYDVQPVSFFVVAVPLNWSGY